MIYPLAITQCDWKVYNQALEDAIGQRATYKIDSKNLSIKKFGTFFHTFDHKHGEILDEALHHGMFTVMITEIFQGTILQLTQSWHCAYSFDRMKDSEHYYVIISGTIANWMQFLLLNCTSDRSKGIRQIGNDVYNLLDAVGFGPAFSFTRYVLQDGTFELCKGK